MDLQCWYRLLKYEDKKYMYTTRLVYHEYSISDKSPTEFSILVVKLGDFFSRWKEFRSILQLQLSDSRQKRPMDIFSREHSVPGIACGDTPGDVCSLIVSVPPPKCMKPIYKYTAPTGNTHHRISSIYTFKCSSLISGSVRPRTTAKIGLQ